ncbi:hypothetical protein SBA1_550106 [Candidatus Sulfotelmatobacter kueseliae]|uniref:Uncharacterized protein n=1 Tax=Candidatus Sulfotelmatobacter kueseliae TaxID=2042962 RepID=A0A2U3KYK8_9BACT|nr:hypothetical protein SBA1_550106 [Candidatus Sulfotelmatobacter kueseliae]
MMGVASSQGDHAGQCGPDHRASARRGGCAYHLAHGSIGTIELTFQTFKQMFYVHALSHFQSRAGALAASVRATGHIRGTGKRWRGWLGYRRTVNEWSCLTHFTAHRTRKEGGTIVCSHPPTKKVHAIPFLT